jgi:predicted enzyme related to lactoylglutathione lyase
MLSKARVAAALPAADLGRAKKFYGEVLGLSVKKENPDGVEYDCGGGTSVFVYPSSFAGTNQATAAGFEVDDIEATKKDLESRGLTFEEYDMPGIKTVNGLVTMPDGSQGGWFKDTEGNILSLMARA